jgi:hypothetical protein
MFPSPHRRITGAAQAFVAMTAVLGGVAAAAVAVHTTTEPFAFTARHELAEPVLPSRIARTADVEIGTVTATLARTPAPRTKLHATPRCVPRWRALEAGPVGRQVLETCPDQPELPRPTLERRGPSQLERIGVPEAVACDHLAVDPPARSAANPSVLRR